MLRVQDKSEIPPLSLILGYGPMLPLALAALLVWIADATVGAFWGSVLVQLAIVWGAAILCFLSGVRRGLSFRMPDGAHKAQIATMLWLFTLGFVALLSPSPLLSLALLLLGYLSIAVLDPLAVRAQEVPPFFARLRPFQMAIGVLSFAVLILWVFLHRP